MSKDIILKVENISKQYRLGQVGTVRLAMTVGGTIRKENPYLKIGDTNDRAQGRVTMFQLQILTRSRTEKFWNHRENGAGKSTLLKNFIALRRLRRYKVWWSQSCLKWVRALMAK
jgi:lipopolysaccharide transport system ATP-binding protein